ncbi:hypothetical protein DPMN_024898 [Dreissena polymorpha]|uniref:Uncharacterized protein n=1 Tax=Dreissena polymorpha TaxID=45954 RepID=A0A9D4RBC0_DREPO|nr:hypothetical protein DPMN_024898 [Dreissena polymorpha]
MAPLVVTGRRLHPRDGFPSALSALSTAAPGSLFKATPAMFWGPPAQTQVAPGTHEPRSAPYVLHTGGLAVLSFPSLYRRDLWQVRASELSTINSG